LGETVIAFASIRFTSEQGMRRPPFVAVNRSIRLPGPTISAVTAPPSQ
jgi:hypothetical protein